MLIRRLSSQVGIYGLSHNNPGVREKSFVTLFPCSIKSNTTSTFVKWSPRAAMQPSSSAAEPRPTGLGFLPRYIDNRLRLHGFTNLQGQIQDTFRLHETRQTFVHIFSGDHPKELGMFIHEHAVPFKTH